VSAAIGRAAAVAAVALGIAGSILAQPSRPVARETIERAVTGAPSRAAEVTTAELRDILATGREVVLDVRSYAEYALGHIPGARSLGEESRSLSALAMTLARRYARGRLDSALVLYGNGPRETRVRRLADTLLSAGMLRVRRYEPGIAVWRALGGVTQIEDRGLRDVVEHRLAVLVDSRDSIRFAAKTISGAVNLPRTRVIWMADSADVPGARPDARWPSFDRDARVVVFGTDSLEARGVADALARLSFRNVSFYAGTFLEAMVASGR
jgi:rhodanese-related sulfurtransferase